MLRKDEQRNFFKRRDYEAVASWQQINTTRAKLAPPVFQEGGFSMAYLMLM